MRPRPPLPRLAVVRGAARDRQIQIGGGEHVVGAEALEPFGLEPPVEHRDEPFAPRDVAPRGPAASGRAPGCSPGHPSCGFFLRCFCSWRCLVDRFPPSDDLAVLRHVFQPASLPFRVRRASGDARRCAGAASQGGRGNAPRPRLRSQSGRGMSPDREDGPDQQPCCAWPRSRREVISDASGTFRRGGGQHKQPGAGRSHVHRQPRNRGRRSHLC